MSENKLGDRTVYYNPNMPQQYDEQNTFKSTLVIVDNCGINEIDLSTCSEAVYSFGRAADNSIVINSDIVSAHHGEICINHGIFF